LDTCTFLWGAAESRKLSKTAASLIQDESNESYLSVASAWEIGMKYAAGRLPLPERPESYIPALRQQGAITSLDVDEESALLASRLAAFHSDPFDRLLVAQAIVHGMTILTPDPEIQKYAVRVLW
jgi:PIN domain nuclease of toxin-antitoxin system